MKKWATCKDKKSRPSSEFPLTREWQQPARGRPVSLATEFARFKESIPASSLSLTAMIPGLPPVAWSDPPQAVRGKCVQYLRMATVSASGELAQGQMTSWRRPLLWKTLRNASQEEIDPGAKEGMAIRQRQLCHQFKISHRRKCFWS